MASTIWSGETSFSATGGSQTVVTLKVPHRGIIKGWSLTQTSGANAGATAALYTSNQATVPNSTLPAEAFHLLDITLPAAPKVDDHSEDIAYINRDGTPSNPQRYLYLKITPAGSGAKTFVFSITIETSRVK
ncbi:hypothetical protein EBZ39_01780 [bacterium]|nr:hypothetical protein [bacterium]